MIGNSLSAINRVKGKRTQHVGMVLEEKGGDKAFTFWIEGQGTACAGLSFVLVVVL